MIDIQTENTQMSDGSEVFTTIIKSQDNGYDDVTVKLDNICLTATQADQFAHKLAILFKEYILDDVIITE